MGKKALTVIALELGSETLKLVEMTRDERRVIATGIFPLAPGRGRDPEHLAAQIRSALDTTAQGNLRALIASVPLGDAWLRLIDLPEGVKGEGDVHEYVEWDMGHYLGRPPGDLARDLALDIIAGPDRPVIAAATAEAAGTAAGRRVIAAAFPRGEAMALRATLESATGLALTALDVDVAALVNVFTANYPEMAGEKAVLIQAHAAATALVRVQDGRFQGVVLRREAAEAVREGGDAQDRAEGYLRRARGAAESLRAGEEGWEAPAHVLVCGELTRDADFRELLRAHLPVPFSLLNPFRNVPGPDPTEHPEAYPGAPLAATVGLALRLAEDVR